MIDTVGYPEPIKSSFPVWILDKSSKSSKKNGNNYDLVSIKSEIEEINSILDNVIEREEFESVNEYSDSIEIVMSNKFTDISGIGQYLFEVLNPYISKITVTYLNKVLRIRLKKEDNWVKDLGVILECISILYKQHKKKGKTNENLFTDSKE